MKRLQVGLLLAVLGAATGLLWWGWPYVTDLLRLRLEQELTRSVGQPCRIARLTIAWWPWRVRAEDIAIGAAPSLAQVDVVEVHLSVVASVAEGRAVLTATVESPDVDLSHLAASSTHAAAHAKTALRFPPLHLKHLEVTAARLRFRLGNSVATLRMAAIQGELKSDWEGRNASLALKVADAEIERKSYHARVNELHVDGGADAGGFYVNTASAVGEGIAATVHATLVAHEHAFTATFEPGILGVVVDELAVIGGQARAAGMLHGDLANPLLDGHLTVQQGSIAHHQLGDLDAQVTLKGAELRFDELQLAGAAGTARGAVELNLEKETPIDGTIEWDDVNLEGLLAVIGSPVPFRTRLQASTAVHGQLDPLDLGVTGGGRLRPQSAAASSELASFDLSARIHPHDLDARLEVTQREQNQLTARVLLRGDDFGGGVGLRAKNLAALTGLLPQPLTTLPLTGQAEGTAEFSGTTDDPVVSGDATMTNLTVAGVAAPRLAGDFSIGGGKLVTKRVRLDTAAGGAELTGTLALNESAENEWQLTLRDLETDVVLGLARGLASADTPLSGGTLNGTLQARGPWRAAQTRTVLTARGMRLVAEPLDHVDLDLTTTLPQWTLQVQAEHIPKQRLAIAGSGDGAARFQLTLDSTPIDLATWRGAERARVAGTVSVHGALSGQPARPDGSVQLTATGLTVSGHQVGDIALQADGRDGAWQLRGDALNGTVTAAATLRTSTSLPYTARLIWSGADVSKVIAGDQALQMTTTGELTLAGSLRAPADSSGAVRVERFDVVRDPVRIEAAEPIQIELDRGRVQVRSLVLAAQGSRVSVSGSGTLRGELALTIMGDGDLVLLELLGEPFASTRGQFAVAAKVAHAGDAGWTVQGQATLRDAALDLGLPVVFTDTNGNVTLDGGRVQIENLSGRVGGGEFHLGGDVDLNRGPALAWTLREVALTMPDWLEERVSGTGRIEGTWKVLTVSGDVDVLNALYDRRVELSDLVPWFKAQVAPAPRVTPPATEVRLDLHIHAPDGLFVDNNIAKIEMRADLRIAGIADKPALSGTVEILNGEVTFRDRLFTISGGSIDFRDPERINPVLNIAAESQIVTTEAEYLVRVVVTGTADAPRVQFTSDDPALSQNDVLSLVTLGRTTTQTTQRDGGAVGVGNVLSLLPTEYTGSMRNTFGVDRLEVEPAYVRDTGTIEPRVTIGKDLTDRIRALASSSFGVEARHSLQLEYRVTRRFSLLGSWESRTDAQAGAFGGDIKFRYEFRTLPFSLFGGGSRAASQPHAP